ncbi:MAG: hypothetical protein WAV16_00880 [Candidatus Moraniibacteriota bacterium]
MERNINYAELIKEAFTLTLKNKFLWWFGLMISFGGLNSSFDFNSSDKKELNEMDYASLLGKVNFYWEHYQVWIILVIVILIVIFIGMIILGMLAQGALIKSTLNILKKEPANFKLGFKQGGHFLSRIFFINLYFSLITIGLTLILFFPVIRLFMLESYGAGIFLAIVAFLIVISSVVLFSFLRKYAQIYLVSGDLKFKESIRLAFALLEKNMKDSFIFGLVNLALGIILGLGLLFVALIILAIGAAIYALLAGKMVAMVLMGLGGLLLFILVAWFSSGVAVFFQTMWILFFIEIATEKKLETNLAPESEIIRKDIMSSESY